VIQCLLPSAVTSLGSPAKASWAWQKGVLGAWTSEYKNRNAAGAIPPRFCLEPFRGAPANPESRDFAWWICKATWRWMPFAETAPLACEGAHGPGDLPDGLFCVQTRLQKYFAGAVGQIRCIESRVLSRRGALANVINAGEDAVDAEALLDAQRGCGRRSRVVLMPRRWHQVGGNIRQ
jgi:hypothetical protein